MKPLIPVTPLLMPESSTNFQVRWFSYNRKWEVACLWHEHWYKANADTLDECMQELHKRILCGQPVSAASTIPRSTAKPQASGRTLAEQEAELAELMKGF